MAKFVVVSAFAAMLTLAAHGQPNRARGGDPDVAGTAVPSAVPASTAPQPPIRNYFEQLERDQAAADAARRADDARRRALGVTEAPGLTPPGESNAPIRFTHQAGRFSVVMPRTPQCSTEHFAAAPPVTEALLLIDRMEYQVTFRDFLPEEMVVLTSDAAVFDRTFQQWLDWVVQKVHGRLEHRVRGAVVGQTAWEFEMVLPDVRHFIGWYFRVGNRLYQVNILGPGLTAGHPTAREFIDSFRLLESL